MGTITVNISNEVEQRFRKRVAQRYGKKKGALGRALAEAMEDWNVKKTDLDVVLELLDKGWDFGNIGKLSKEEIHDRS